MKKMKRRLTLFCTLLLVAMMIPSKVFAAGTIDPNRDVTFGISYQDEETAISGGQFDLYRVADVDAYANMTITKNFSKYPVHVDGLDQKGWSELAHTLKGYAQRDHVNPDATAVTDAEGKLSLTLKPGLYLVVGNICTIGNDIYSAAPYMVFLPGIDKVENAWNYQVNSSPKYSKEQQPDEQVVRKALKIWDDKGHESARPSEIVVKLLCDGTVHDTVMLNEANNWRWTWENLEKGHDWMVVEDEVDGYTTTVTQQGITFTITNTAKPETPPEPTEPVQPNLPQTGLLWWPVLPLIAVGLLFIMIGVIRRKGGNRA